MHKDTYKFDTNILYILFFSSFGTVLYLRLMEHYARKQAVPLLT